MTRKPRSSERNNSGRATLDYRIILPENTNKSVAGTFYVNTEYLALLKTFLAEIKAPFIDGVLLLTEEQYRTLANWIAKAKGYTISKRKRKPRCTKLHTTTI